MNERTPRRTAYVNARLLDPASRLDAPGALLAEDGRIADLGPRLFADGLPEGIETVDCGGACLAPGLVDIRVHLCEPGDEHKETVETASRAAAAGGITAMCCLPNTEPPIDDVSVVEFVARRAREVKLVKIFAYGAVTKGIRGAQMAEFGLLAAAGAVAFTDGTRTVSDSLVMRRALAYAGTFGLLIMQHPEDTRLADGGVMNEGETATRLGLSGVPSVAEVLTVERDLRLVGLTGGRYHAAHLSTAAAIDAIRKAKQAGMPVSCDTAPPYFTLNETAIAEYRTFFKVSPPLRSEEDRLAVVDGLADGTIDAIASDHSPQDQESKRLPFALAEDGMVGLESLLPLVLGLYHGGTMGLLDALALVTCRPADLLGFPFGRLEVGVPADLVVFDVDRPWRIDTKSFLSKCKNSPYDGHPVQGRVLRTVVDGRAVFLRNGLAKEPSPRRSGYGGAGGMKLPA